MQAKKLMQFDCVKMDFVTYLINSQPKKWYKYAWDNFG
jgi:hypothetical protein